MSREKQIEKMAKVIKSSLDGLGCGNFNFTGDEISTMFAEALYNADCRKQSEGEWLLIKVPTGVELYGIREVQAYPKCSICSYMGDVSEWHFKYCPNCGAKMKGGAE